MSASNMPKPALSAYLELFRKRQVDAARHIELSLIEDPTMEVEGEDWCAWCLWPAAKARFHPNSSMFTRSQPP